MKKAVISVVMLGMASFCYSQLANRESDTIVLAGVEVTPMNLDYKKNVIMENLPDHVAALEKKVSRFNIRESFFFDTYSKNFEIDFISKNGEILATYDRNGKILETDERFEEIVFPPAVQNEIDREYPNWAVHKDAYLVTYHHENGVSKMYKAQLRRYGKRVNVKYGVSGNKLE